MLVQIQFRYWTAQVKLKCLEYLGTTTAPYFVFHNCLLVTVKQAFMSLFNLMYFV